MIKIGKHRLGFRVILARVFSLLSKVWFVPFGYYQGPIMTTGVIPHPLKPRNLRDLVLNRMMFPDDITRAIVSDKIAAREWAAERVGPDLLVPLYDICDSIEELHEKNYPYPYVVKTNHGSGQIAFVRDDNSRQKMLSDVEKWDAGEYNSKTEWGYHDIKRKFMVEKMLVDDEMLGTHELKVICFFGEPVLVRSNYHRPEKTDKAFLTPDWETLDVQYLRKVEIRHPDRPEALTELLRITKILSEKFDYARVDLFICNGHVYFGELTNFMAAGTALFEPKSYDEFLYKEYLRIRKERISEARDGYHEIAEQRLEG